MGIPSFIVFRKNIHYRTRGKFSPERRFNMSKKILLLLFAVCLVSGCGKKEDLEQTKETELAVITPTVEREYKEKEITTKDVQLSVSEKCQSGSLQYQISVGSETREGIMNYQASPEAFYAAGQDSALYAGTECSMFRVQDKWIEQGESFQDLFNKVQEDAELKKDASVDGISCHHLQIKNDDVIPICFSLLYLNGIRDAANSEMDLDFYINQDNGNIIRTEISMPFLGSMKNKETEGVLTIRLTANEWPDDLQIPKPEIEMENNRNTYETGNIVEDKNVYRNDVFKIQVLGKNLINFDSAKTQELKEQYLSSGSNYQEEAYALGENLILNISSINTELNTEEIMKKYLSDSGASDIKISDPLKAADLELYCAVAKINSTKTKSYCVKKNQLSLIMTLYYLSDDNVKSFEGNIFSTDEDPFWQEENWTLLDKYTVKTIKGYTIDTSNSGNLYVCMKSSGREINIFALENTSLENEIEKQIESEDGETKEIISNTQIPLNSGNLTYLIIHSTEPDFEYWIHVGLQPVENGMLEYYSIETEEDADCSDVFRQFAEGCSVVTQNGTDQNTETSQSLLEEQKK